MVTMTTALMAPFQSAAASGVAPRTADLDGQAFSRHQAWLKACEHAAQEARPAMQAGGDHGQAAGDAPSEEGGDAGPVSGPGAMGILDQAHAPALPEAAEPPHLNAMGDPPRCAGMVGMARAPTDGATASRIPPVIAQPPLAHSPRGPGVGTGLDHIDTAEPAMPFTPSAVFEQARRLRAFAPLPETCVTVYQDTGRLSLAVRDARLAEGEGESILHRLHAEGLPPGVRHLSVTVNGRHHQRDLSSEGN